MITAEDCRKMAEEANSYESRLEKLLNNIAFEAKHGSYGIRITERKDVIDAVLAQGFRFKPDNSSYTAGTTLYLSGNISW